MRKDGKPSAQEALGVFFGKDVRHDADTKAVRLVDDRAVHFRGQLVILPIAIIDPNLDDVDVNARKMLNRRNAFFDRFDPIDALGPSGFGSRNSAPCGEIACSAWNELGARRDEFVGIAAHAHGSADTEGRAADKIVDDTCAISA